MIGIDNNIDINEYATEGNLEPTTETSTPVEMVESKSKNYKSKKDKSKVYTAKVLNVGKGYVDVDFKGYGIRIKTDKEINTDTVDIEYKNEIGTKDFERKLV